MFNLEKNSRFFLFPHSATISPPEPLNQLLHLPNLIISGKKTSNQITSTPSIQSPTIDVSDEEIHQNEGKPGLLTFTHSFIPSVPEFTKHEARIALLNYVSSSFGLLA